MSMRSSSFVKRLMVNTVMAWMALASITLAPASGQQPLRAIPPNGVPLLFGMTADEVSQALGVPLNYVRGRPGNELLIATSNVKGSADKERFVDVLCEVWQAHFSSTPTGTLRPTNHVFPRTLTRPLLTLYSPGKRSELLTERQDWAIIVSL